ncbi:helix-turn-helix domain-containing protein [Shewanella baltica]|uniref:winged helix-turn-helix domain-containing protein n=1 Tax=Shewanella baltica TaxID=62322 RepID=UPI00217D97A9|nr:winged helix-turn-helix domain-containing protein [Shewanella baltica]MCS6271817.1 helix-turn-helix domain-containing protein [Shewanella baltica]
MQIKNLFESAYYRRLALAYVIDEQGPINSAEIAKILNWPKNTIKTNLIGLQDMGIEIDFEGAKKTGGYKLVSWGPIKKSWVKQRFEEIKFSFESDGLEG